jgi:hypothetical protein
MIASAKAVTRQLHQLPLACLTNHRRLSLRTLALTPGLIGYVHSLRSPRHLWTNIMTTSKTAVSLPEEENGGDETLNL